MTFINHYEILEIEANADLSAIKSAFNKLAMRYHPDRNLGDPIAEAMMKKLNQALRTLSDSKLRKEHDETLFKNKPNTPPKSHRTTTASDNAEPMQTKDLHEAIAACTQAINLNPKDTKAYLNRAAAYKALSDQDLALAQKATTVKKRKTKGAKEESIDLGKGISLQLVLILAGKFQMGSDPSDEDHNEDETQYEANISKPFYLGKYQITQAQWEVVMGYNPSKIKGPDLPVTNVSWEDCQKFINNLNADSEECFRLPTEAEWEYACRAGTDTSFSFGNRITTVDANCDYKIRKPIAVGSYEPNSFGIYDMHGNVFEWCRDWYGVYPKRASTDPQGPTNGTDHVMRGGSFCVKASSVRSALRNSGAPNFQSNDLGFRIAQTINS